MNKQKKETVSIALCDDDAVTHKTVEDNLVRYEKTREIGIEIIHFYSAMELIKYTGKIHILLLDIAMPDMDGIEAGLILREEKKDYRIIMLTSMRERAAESMKIGAFRFVEKPIWKDNSFFEALDDALITFLGYKKINARYKNKNVDIFQYQIESISSMGNYVRIKTESNLYEKNTTIKNIISELDERLFVQTEKSHIVNLSFVKEIRSNQCILADETQIPISRRAFKKVLAAYSMFDAKGYNGIRNGYFY